MTIEALMIDGLEEMPDPGDSASYMRMLEKAESDMHLDGAAFLDELGRAAQYCAQQTKLHTSEADKHFLSRCAYIAEAHRRTRTIGNLRHKGSGFQGWCLQHGVATTYANILQNIGNSPNPVAAMKSYRKRHNESVKKRLARGRIAQEKLEKIERHDPLERAWDAVRKLSPAQKLELLKRMFNESSAGAGAPSPAGQQLQISLQ